MADQSLDFPDSDDGLIEKTVESKLLHQGKFLTLKIDTVELPDGKHATREYVEHPGAVMILPLFDDGRVLLERQYRYPIAKVLLEFPAGKLDPNESELACAKRELHEETGLYGARMVFPDADSSGDFVLDRIHRPVSGARLDGRREQARRGRVPRDVHRGSGRRFSSGSRAAISAT